MPGAFSVFLDKIICLLTTAVRSAHSLSEILPPLSSRARKSMALESLGAKVVALACIVDRRAEGITAPWPLYPAVKVDVANWEAADCELCKKGIPVVKPGSRKF